MNLEIERKFLVNDFSFKKEAFTQKIIKQGYLNTDKNRVVRIRVADEKAYLTIKGKTNESGTTRFEWEKEIDILEANQLLLLSETEIVEKTRYLVQKGNHVFEVDKFTGKNEGLLLAEIELTSEDEVFEKPHKLQFFLN